MRKINRELSVLVATICIVLTCCLNLSCFDGLSESQAAALVREAEGYPELASIIIQYIPHDSPLANEVFRLVNEGQLIKPPPSPYFMTFRGVEGNKYVEECQARRSMDFDFCRFITHEIDITSIDEILIDKDDNAIVEYTIDAIPTSYHSKLRELDAKRVDEATNSSLGWVKQQKKRVYLKKWDKGWRIIH